ncbi:polysaccharide deacetylase family protein [Paenibacillus sp. TRM 82003]|nr:polysaccharide deacetylase family protein [Paenibacillus sp. TRM 82003]
MKSTIRFGAAYLVLALALSGCGGDAAPTPEPARVEAPPADVAETPSETAGGAEEEPAASEDAPVAEAPEEPQVVEQDYYMNASNFILKPKEEDGNKKVVLLTFDDGPKEEEMLNAMLDTLDRYEAKAIFFVNGYRAEKKPELVQLMYDRGHAVGNHSWDHIDLKKESEDKVKQQIGDLQRLVESIIGEAPVFFRPPHGSGGDIVKKVAAEENLLYMTWSNGSRDWVKGYDKPEKVIESVLEQLHPGSNILMHELPWTAEALDGLLKTLQEKGYAFLDPKRIDPDYSKN